MGAHKQPESDGVHSSPASVRHYQTRDHSRNNPQLSVKPNALTDRQNMMSDAVNTSIPLLFDNMMKIYFPESVGSDGFNNAFPEDKIQRIHTKLSGALEPRSDDSTDKRRKEKIMSKTWLEVDTDETLCPGYSLNISENHPDVSDPKGLKIDGAMISTLFKDAIQKNRPNYDLDDLAIEFKSGGTENDAWDDRAKKNMESTADTRFRVRGQLMSYGERHFYYQHRTGLFMLFVNGGEFRIIRWDRSGCIVTEALNYVESSNHTKKLLRFLYAYSQATPEPRGIDTTATRLSKDSCGWQWMQKLAAAHAKDLDHADGTVLDSVPDGFVLKATLDADDSPLFASNVLAEDPAATTGFTDLSSLGNTSSMVTPVFKYVRDLFRESVPQTWTCYSLKVDGRDYLVGKPTFAPQGMVGRGTRGYVALEWRTQRFVFLKDAWRPFYQDVDPEGDTLKILNDAHLPFVPTLVCHGDVDNGNQETHASEYSATGTKKPDVFGTQGKEDRPIAPMPSRSKGSRSRSATAASGRSTSTIPTSDGSGVGQSSGARSSGTSGRSSGKRARPQTNDPVEILDGTGLRHLTHYRIVVAQVCLSSCAFTNGKQLVRLLWNCIEAHGDAVEQCNILHRDVSVGNILILPTVKIRTSKTKGQSISVVWGGLLCDWELAKKCPDGQEKPKARQPHRTGTWNYMSVYSVQHPGIPVSNPDEIESFFHVLLYLALRYLRSDLESPGVFMDEYFLSSGKGRGGVVLCAALKRHVVTEGELVFSDEAVKFLSIAPSSSESSTVDGPPIADSPPPSPLNQLIQDLLDHFKAHYAVRKYNTAIAAQTQQLRSAPDRLPSLYDGMKSTSVVNDGEDDSDDEEAELLGMRLQYGDAQTPARATPKVTEVRPAPAPEIKEPSDEEKRRAARLATHEWVKDLFFSYVRPKVAWPSDDYIGDQLKGYVRAETTKRPRLEGTTPMPRIPEGEDVSAQVGSAA